MRDSILSLLKGVIIVHIIEGKRKTIIELSFYDKQHGINSDYPCINTGIIDENGEDWFTKTYFTWTDFINELQAYISYYKEERQAESIYVKECEFL